MTSVVTSTVLLPGVSDEFVRRWRALVAEFGGTVNDGALQVRCYSQELSDAGVPMQLNVELFDRGIDTVDSLAAHSEQDLLTKFRGVINYGRIRQLTRILAASGLRFKNSAAEPGDQIEQLTQLHLDVYTILKKAGVHSLSALLEMDIAELDHITRGRGPSVARALDKIDRKPKPLGAGRTVGDLGGWSFEALSYLGYRPDVLVSSLTISGLIRDLTAHFAGTSAVIDEEGIRDIAQRFVDDMLNRLFTQIPA